MRRWVHPVTVVVLLIAITVLHHLTAVEDIVSHNLFRRLYYLPIIMGAFVGGLTGGLGAALAACALYAPHAFFMHHHLDPAPMADKVLEMVLYIVVGGLAGLLLERERRAQRARQEAEGRAARLESLVTLTSGLAHEIRNPLASIQGSFEILEGDYATGTPKRAIVERGLRETARLDRVLDDFAAFARPRPPVPAPSDLVDILRDVCDAARLQHPALDVQLDAPASLRTRGLDPAQVQQCLLNLVLNAAQWSPPESTIRVHLAQRGDGLHVTVDDTGPGVPPEDASRIFDPYFTRRSGGSGLGLAIAAGIARAHGGALTYVAREAGGARFVLTLPA